jgi:hypothetical protein
MLAHAPHAMAQSKGSRLPEGIRGALVHNQVS